MLFWCLSVCVCECVCFLWYVVVQQSLQDTPQWSHCDGHLAFRRVVPAHWATRPFSHQQAFVHTVCAGRVKHFLAKSQPHVNHYCQHGGVGHPFFPTTVTIIVGWVAHWGARVLSSWENLCRSFKIPQTGVFTCVCYQRATPWQWPWSDAKKWVRREYY